MKDMYHTHKAGFILFLGVPLVSAIVPYSSNTTFHGATITLQGDCGSMAFQIPLYSEQEQLGWLEVLVRTGRLHKINRLIGALPSFSFWSNYWCMKCFKYNQNNCVIDDIVKIMAPDFYLESLSFRMMDWIFQISHGAVYNYGKDWWSKFLPQRQGGTIVGQNGWIYWCPIDMLKAIAPQRIAVLFFWMGPMAEKNKTFNNCGADKIRYSRQESKRWKLGQSIYCWHALTRSHEVFLATILVMI